MGGGGALTRYFTVCVHVKEAMEAQNKQTNNKKKAKNT